MPVELAGNDGVEDPNLGYGPGQQVVLHVLGSSPRWLLMFFRSRAARPLPDFGLQADPAVLDPVGGDEDDAEVRGVRALEEEAQSVGPEGVPGFAVCRER